MPFFSIHSRSFLLIHLIVLCFSFPAIAQVNQPDTAKKVADSVKPDLFILLKNAGKKEAENSIIKFKEDQISYQQNRVLQEIKKTTQRAKAYLKRGIDTTEIKAELNKISDWLETAGNGILNNAADIQTHRNLTTTSKLIYEILNKARIQKSKIDAYEKELVDYRIKLDSLSSDTSLYVFSSDTAMFTAYFQKLIVASLEIKEPDSNLKVAITNIQILQSLADIYINNILTDLDDIKKREEELSHHIFKPEIVEKGQPKKEHSTLVEVLKYSTLKGKILLVFFTENNPGKLLFMLFLTVGLGMFLSRIKKRLKEKNELKVNDISQAVIQYPYLTSLLIILSVFQFIFTDPPFIFSALLWLICFVGIIITFHRFMTRFWFVLWLALFSLFLLASLDNLLLEVSELEIQGIYLLSAAGMITGTVILANRRKNELLEKWVLLFIAIMIIMEFAALISIFYGRYNLAKNLMTTGYFNVIISIIFLFTIRCINDILALASQVYSKPNQNMYYLDFDKIGKRAPNLFYFVSIFGWIILFGRNFYSFRLLSQPVKDFFVDERTIGNYTFSLNNLLVFFLIMFISMIVSKVVSFFASDQETAAEDQKPKKGVGSWLLLIRIIIISIGIFMAFAAAGIPMDRIAIIIGALGVGIGLGLQALVNNLVSGLIIAFEKPVNVGDVVEISGQSGTMKSIGFRSSVISTWDGADMIIPNGDLLNAHLINWTLSGSMRRVELLVGVAYKTDLELTKKILLELVELDDRILKSPAPAIIINEFNSSSIDIRILFWVNKYGDWVIVKSDLITAIDIAFKKHNIEIPYPQQDVHIRTADEKKMQQQDALNDT